VEKFRNLIGPWTEERAGRGDEEFGRGRQGISYGHKTQEPPVLRQEALPFDPEKPIQLFPFAFI
jgi:hypothetical protein